MKRKPTVSIDTIKKLGQYLNTIGQSEERLERYRQKLCKLIAFEPYASFQRLDRASKGSITARDI
jgi:hypothetical protein